MSLKTNRLILDRLSLDHAEPILAMRKLKEIYIWTLSGRWESIQQSIDWINSALSNSTAMNYIVTVKKDSPLYGTLSAKSEIPRLAADPAVLAVGSIGIMRAGEIGYMIHPDSWGLGIAPEALQAIIPAYFDLFPEEAKLTAHVDDQNERSISVLKRLGFKEVGRGPVEMVEMGKRTEVIFEIVAEVGLKLNTKSIEAKKNVSSGGHGDQLAKVAEVDIA